MAAVKKNRGNRVLVPKPQVVPGDCTRVCGRRSLCASPATCVAYVPVEPGRASRPGQRG